MKNLFCFFFFFLFGQLLVAQTLPIDPNQARSELNRRNVDEGELKARLLERGIDVDNMSPAELAAAQPQIEAVVAELEAEASRPSGGEAVFDTVAPQPQPVVPPTNDAQSPTNEVASDTIKSDIWGHEVFRNKSLEVYRTTDNVRPPDSYRLGVGDAVAISIFGTSQADLKFIINTEGFIFPPSMPRIYLKGITLVQARELVRKRFQQYYIFKEGEFSFNVDVARTITVNIFGETELTGSFTISAVNTVFNALVAAGGPTPQGSVRQLKLMRGGKEILIDTYEFLLNPAKPLDLFLENNDVIFVPLAETIVTVKGAVRRPLKYELLPTETVENAIAYAGGFEPNAAPEGITVEQVSNGRITIIDADFSTEAGKGLRLQSSSVVNVPAVLKPIRESVAISGAVKLPGEYAYQDGMKVSDLIRRGGLTEESRQDVAFLRRQNVDSTSNLLQLSIQDVLTGQSADLRLERGDSLLVLGQALFANQAVINVTGAVRTPLVNYPFSTDGQISVEKAILLAGGLKQNASNAAYLIRKDPQNKLIEEYRYVNLDTPVGQETKLLSFDSLVVYSAERFTDAFKVSIRGAVREPGVFAYHPSLSLKDLFLLGGGFTSAAARNKIEVFRLEVNQDAPTKTVSITIQVDEQYNLLSSSVPNFRLQPYDVIAVREVAEFELINTVSIQGEVRYPGEYALDKDNLRLSDLVTKAGGLTAESFIQGASLTRSLAETGIVVIRLTDALADPNSESNITLKDGDVLSIPKALDVISIVPRGTRAQEAYDEQVVADGALDVAFYGNRSAKWYIDRYAAGFTDQALRRSVTVQYPNGELGRTKKILWFNNYPEVRSGSIIKVTEDKREKEKKERREERFDWKGTIQVVIGGATSFLTLYLLTREP